MAMEMLLMQQLSTFALMSLLLLSTYAILVKLTLMGLILWYMLVLFSNCGSLYSAGSILPQEIGVLPESRGALFFSDLFTKMSMYQYPMFVAALYDVYLYRSTMGQGQGQGHDPVNNWANITNPASSSKSDLEKKDRQNEDPSKNYVTATSGDKLFLSLQGPVILHSFWCEVAIMLVSDLVNGGVVEQRPIIHIFDLDHVIHYTTAAVHLLMSLGPFLPEFYGTRASNSTFNLTLDNALSIFLHHVPQPPGHFTGVLSLLSALTMIFCIHVNPVLLEEFGGPTVRLRKYLFGMRIAHIFQAVTLVSLM